MAKRERLLFLGVTLVLLGAGCGGGGKLGGKALSQPWERVVHVGSQIVIRD